MPYTGIFRGYQFPLRHSISKKFSSKLHFRNFENPKVSKVGEIEHHCCSNSASIHQCFEILEFRILGQIFVRKSDFKYLKLRFTFEAEMFPTRTYFDLSRARIKIRECENFSLFFSREINPEMCPCRIHFDALIHEMNSNSNSSESTKCVRIGHISYRNSTV